MTKEIYKLGQTGRVKAAGVPFDVMFDPAEKFKDNPSAASGSEMTNYYQHLRHAPPDEVRNRFFPRDRGNKEMFRKGPLLTRPVLKTDQGAGQFLSFEVNTDGAESLAYTINAEEGYCINEPFFEKQLITHQYPSAVIATLREVESHFATQNLQEAQLAYERLQMICGVEGIEATRNAQVGRDALFFIHPAMSEEPIKIPVTVFHRIEQLIREQTAQFKNLATEARSKFAQERGLLINSAQIYEPLYFQADVQIFKNGGVVLDQIHLPDVGFFLTGLEIKGNESLAHIQKGVLPLRDKVVDRISNIVQKRHKTNKVHLITRSEVVNSDEDVLETTEIEVLKQALGERGVETKIISVEEALFLKPDDVGLLLNADVTSTAFTQLLLQRLTDGRTAIYPDPFLQLAAQDVTGYFRKNLTFQQIEALQELTRDIDFSKPEHVFRTVLSLDNYLHRLGIHEDVFHIHSSSQKTPIACFRYDVRGIQIALSYIKGKDVVNIRSVPISPEQAVLFKKYNRPIYAVFRFMAIQEDL